MKFGRGVERGLGWSDPTVRRADAHRNACIQALPREFADGSRSESDGRKGTDATPKTEVLLTRLTTELNDVFGTVSAAYQAVRVVLCKR